MQDISGNHKLLQIKINFFFFYFFFYSNLLFFIINKTLMLSSYRDEVKDCESRTPLYKASSAQWEGHCKLQVLSFEMIEAQL